MAGLTYSRTAEKATVDRWNGSRWLAVTSPHPVVADGPGVTALSPSNVWLSLDTETNAYTEHWNGHRWQPFTPPGNVVASTSDIVPDGRGGDWFGPYADWTGHTWINAFGFSSAFYGGGFQDFARIPGTTSLVGVGGFDHNGSTTQYPQIYRLIWGKGDHGTVRDTLGVNYPGCSASSMTAWPAVSRRCGPESCQDGRASSSEASHWSCASRSSPHHISVMLISSIRSRPQTTPPGPGCCYSRRRPPAGRQQ